LDLRSAICVPLVAGERTLGSQRSSRRVRRAATTGSDLTFAQGLARRAAMAVDNTQVHSERLEASLQVQQALLPRS
jgi:GAF domain-containing protein